MWPHRLCSRPGGGSGAGNRSRGAGGARWGSQGGVAGSGSGSRWLAAPGPSGTGRWQLFGPLAPPGVRRRGAGAAGTADTTDSAGLRVAPAPPRPAASQLSMQRPSRIGTASPSVAIRRSGRSWTWFSLPAGERGEGMNGSSTRQTRVSFLYCQKDR